MLGDVFDSTQGSVHENKISGQSHNIWVYSFPWQNNNIFLVPSVTQMVSFTFLMHTMLEKKIQQFEHFEIFFLFFSQKIGFDILCKLPQICMKCQSLFS